MGDHMIEPLNEAEHDAYWRPLGQLLVQRGLLTADELEAALDEQARTGGRLGEILLRQGLLSRLALASSLYEQASGDQAERGFGSGLRSALADSDPVHAAGNEPLETEGGFGSGLRDALEASQDADELP
jgi:hypothetical protein